MKTKLLLCLMLLTPTMLLSEGTTKYTDSEEQIRENYVHKGLESSILKNECSDGKCDDRAAKLTVGSFTLPPELIQNASKAIAMFIATGKTNDDGKVNMGGVSDDQISTIGKWNAEAAKKATEAKSADALKTDQDKLVADNAKKKREEDYCKMIPAAVEALATFMQMVNQNNISSATIAAGSEQKEALYKVARSHDKLAETAKFQEVGWGATTACYTAMVAASAATAGGGAAGAMFAAGNTTYDIGLKLAASGVMTYFYDLSRQAEENAAAEVRKIAKELPGKGDCNPIDQLNCYCSQDSTKNDPKYCVIQSPRAQKLGSGRTYLVCVDKSMKADPECGCSQNDSCFSQQFETVMAGTSFGRTFVNGPQSELLNSTSQGYISNNYLNGSSTKEALAAAKRQLEEIADKYTDNESYSKSEQGLLSRLKSMGIPEAIAGKIVKSADSPNFASQYYARATVPDYTNKKTGYVPSNEMLKYGKGGNSITNFNNRATTPDQFGGVKGTAVSGNKNDVLKFAEMAAQQAQINTRAEDSVFDIISHRYQTSGRRILLEGNPETKP